jgi:hypothetical protein
MAPQNLADFLKEKTRKEIRSDGDGLLDIRTDIQVLGVSKPEAGEIRRHIVDFYGQNGYEEHTINEPDDFSLVFTRE